MQLMVSRLICIVFIMFMSSYGDLLNISLQGGEGRGNME